MNESATLAVGWEITGCGILETLNDSLELPVSQQNPNMYTN